jgi:hypothetical protein
LRCFGRVDAEQPDAMACNVQGVAVDHLGVAGELAVSGGRFGTAEQGRCRSASATAVLSHRGNPATDPMSISACITDGPIMREDG